MSDPEGLWDDETDNVRPNTTLSGADDEATMLDIPAASREELKPFAELEMDGATDRVPPTDRFGRFLLLEIMGQGGMAEVRRAVELRPDGRRRPCVVKRLLPGRRYDEEYHAMLLEEARICQRLSHPNIVATYDSGIIEGMPYIAFEVIEGPSLKDCIVELGAAPMPVAFRIAMDVARALEHVHGMTRDSGEPLALIHRDVTPENILLGPHCAKLADFGIARHEERDFETRTGIVKGKLCYMAPEIFEERRLDGRTDIFSLGLVLAEILLGKPVVPPTAIGVLAIEDLDAHLVSILSDRGLPLAAIELVRRMSAWRSEDRPSSAAEVQSRLRDLDVGPRGASIRGDWASAAVANPFETPTLRTESSIDVPDLPGVYDLEDETELGVRLVPRRRSR